MNTPTISRASAVNEFCRYYFHWLEERFGYIFAVVMSAAITVCAMDLRADWRFLTQLDSLAARCQAQHKVLAYANQHFDCVPLTGRLSWYIQTKEEQ